MAKRKQPAAQEIRDIAAFLEVVGLTDVVLHEERSRRVESESPEEVEPEVTSTLGINSAKRRFSFRFRVVYKDGHGEYLADFAPIYESDQDLAVDQAVLAEFAGRVGFMTAYPYVRASIQSAAARMENPAPVLGMVRQGEFELGEKLTPEEARAVFEPSDES